MRTKSTTVREDTFDFTLRSHGVLHIPKRLTAKNIRILRTNRFIRYHRVDSIVIGVFSDHPPSNKNAAVCANLNRDAERNMKLTVPVKLRKLLGGEGTRIRCSIVKDGNSINLQMERIGEDTPVTPTLNPKIQGQIDELAEILNNTSPEYKQIGNRWYNTIMPRCPRCNENMGTIMDRATGVSLSCQNCGCSIAAYTPGQDMMIVRADMQHYITGYQKLLNSPHESRIKLIEVTQ